MHVDEVWTAALADALIDADDAEALQAHPAVVPLNLYPDDLDELLAGSEAVAAVVQAVG